MLSQFAQLEKFEGNWAIQEVIKQALSSRRKYKAQLEAAKKNDTDTDDDDDESDGSDAGSVSTPINDTAASVNADNFDMDHTPPASPLASPIRLPTSAFPVFPSPPQRLPFAPLNLSRPSLVEYNDDDNDLSPLPVKKAKIAKRKAAPKRAKKLVKVAEVAEVAAGPW